MKEFNREDNALLIVYDPQTFEPLKQYQLTLEQTKFLIKIEKYIAGLNVVSTMDEVQDQFKYIANIIEIGLYNDTDIPSLLEIREQYKFLYKKNINLQDSSTNPCAEIFMK
jgi:hypothetical protein